MGRKRTFTKMVSGESERQPAVRITFKGKYQHDYFTLANAADEMSEICGEPVTQTHLGRLIISDWLKLWREKRAKGTGTQQMVMILAGAKKTAGSAGKPEKGGKKDK